ncbi:MAG: phosphoribosyltransferase family protein [Gammaproteobacteria bacterium]|nr:phosphoribosyltransferase family protein [Gammaproteobacteria bacterium]
MKSAPLPAAFGVEAELVYSAAEIATIIDAMAAAITARLGTADPIVMPILIGGAFTAVKLCERFGFAYEIDAVRVSRYRGAETGGRLEWHHRPGRDVAGRHVLLVDDVLDRGITLAAVARELSQGDAASVSTAVLIQKPAAAGAERPAVDFVGAGGPDRFLFGCGMDYRGRWRGLPALYAAVV